MLCSLALNALMVCGGILDWHLGLGERDADTGRHANALYHFRRAVALGPGNHIARYDLAMECYKFGDIDCATQQLAVAVSLATNSLAPVYNLAAIYGKTGRTNEAEMLYHRYLDMKKRGAPEIE